LYSLKNWGVSGIQQVGIGVADLDAAFSWCRTTLGMDVPVFRDEGRAELMTRYTGGVPQERRAVLAVNLRGGGGLEIWQYTKRVPQEPPFPPLIGDLGILSVTIKTDNLAAARSWIESRDAGRPGTIAVGPVGEPHFFFTGPGGLLFEVVEHREWFGRRGGPVGGVCGCMIGVSDIDRARCLYSELLGYRRVIHDARGVFEDLRSLPGGHGELRRVMLEREDRPAGALSRLLGSSRIELVQALDRVPRRVFQDRFWGDLGFIHLCFDSWGLEGLKEASIAAGFPLTVDSAQGFDMGEATGRFAYVEDPDGTLIELVEPYRIGIVPAAGWYLDLRGRDQRKPLPDVLLKAMALKRVRRT
jgi:catechol 2,3-dioxygenase-like lactoylglutathione lyase family enzyme